MTVDLSNPTTESIGERCFIAKVTGDFTYGTCYFAVRTSGAYGAGDASIIKAGTGALDHQSQHNGYRICFLSSGGLLTPDTQFYWGCVVELSSVFGAVASGSLRTLALASDIGDVPRPGIPS